MSVDRVKYDRVAMNLHWIIAVLMVPMLFLGEELMEAEDGFAGTLLPTAHVSIGVSILLLSLARIFWRLLNPPPPAPLTLRPWEAAAATITHVLFYILMIALPVSGLLLVPEFIADEPGMAGLSFFGIIPVPLAFDGGDVAGVVHKLGSKAGIALVVLHVVAALKHQFIDGDGVLRRMLPY